MLFLYWLFLKQLKFKIVNIANLAYLGVATFAPLQLKKSILIHPGLPLPLVLTSMTRHASDNTAAHS